MVECVVPLVPFRLPPNSHQAQYPRAAVPTPSKTQYGLEGKIIVCKTNELRI